MASLSRSFLLAPAGLRSAAAIITAALVASACAPSSHIDVLRTGDIVGTAPQAYVLTMPSDEAAMDLAADQAVKRQLDHLGWRTASTSPDWRVETAYVVRANSVGVFEGVDQIPDEDWLVQPQHRPWWERKSSIHALTVRLVKPATGEEAGRATAHAHVAGTPADDLLDRLAFMAVTSALGGSESLTR